MSILNNKDEILKLVNEKVLGFEYTLNQLLDHLAILSWLQYISHRCDVNKPNKNFDDREWIELPSGRKITITVNIEEWKENV